MKMRNVPLIAGLVLATAAANTPAFASDAEQRGYLRAVYSWQIPLPFKCGTLQPFSTKVPFAIEGNRIRGLYDIGEVEALLPRVLPLPVDDEDPLLEDVFVMPDTPSQEIDYSYKCGACTVSGSVVIHKLRGKVVGSANQRSLRFSMTYSNPACRVDCGSYELSCRDTEKVVDMFQTPIKDGYVVDRGGNVFFKYLLRLE